MLIRGGGYGKEMGRGDQIRDLEQMARGWEKMSRDRYRGGGGYGKRRDRGERIRDVEILERGREKMGRERERGGGFGKEKDRGTRIRDWEQLASWQEKTSRKPKRHKKERDLSRRHEQRQQRQQRRHDGGESGEIDRAVSPLFGRPPSAGSGSATMSIPRNSLFPAGDGVLDREAGRSGEGWGSGARSSGKDVDREPGELPMSGRRVEEISWRSDILMSLHSTNARTKQPVERDWKPSPTNKRKFSPIFWNHDGKRVRPSILSSVSGASSGSPVSKFGGAQSSQGLLVQTSSAVQDLSTPPANYFMSPLSNSPLSGGATPPRSAVVHGGQVLSSSPQESTPPIVKQSLYSAFVEESNHEPDILGIQMEDQVTASPMSDEPEPGQFFPDPIESSRRDSPKVELEEEDGTTSPPFTIAASRWAGAINTPGRAESPRAGGWKARKRSSSSESEEGRVSLGQDGGHLTSSPEAGEFIREKVDSASGAKDRNNDRSIEQGSGGKYRRGNSIEDEKYGRELNNIELMELEEEESDKYDAEEQRRELEPVFEGVPLVPSGPQPRAIDMLQGCRRDHEFDSFTKINEGTYGVVYRARNKKTRETVALKKVKMDREKEGFPVTSLREINILLSFHHPSVVNVTEVVVGSTTDKIFLVMEYMEHDMKGLMETMNQHFSQSEVKCLMLQLLEGVKYLHDNWVLHRDLKTSNLLLNNRGELKICDFGLARQYGSPLKIYSPLVVSLWYRAPELLLSDHYQYSTAIDMWSLGCIMAEFLSKEPLFNGNSEIDQVKKIFEILGKPDKKTWPEFASLPGARCNFEKQPYSKLREKFPATGFTGRPVLSNRGFDLLNRLLTCDPQKRITADEALKHDWFREMPLPKSKESMPTFPARIEHNR